jgi:hypothetical protein
VTAAERRLVPRAIRLIAEGGVEIKDGRTFIREHSRERIDEPADEG